MNCQSCKSERIADVGGKCSDCFGMTINGKDYDGYVPDDIGIGGGDYIGFKYCLACGKIQGKFPLPKTKLEESSEEE